MTMVVTDRINFMLKILRYSLVLFSIMTLASGAATAAPIMYSFGPLNFFMPGTGSLSVDLEFDPMTSTYTNINAVATGTTGRDGVYSVIDGVPDKLNLSLFQVGGGGAGSSILKLVFNTPGVIGGGLGDVGLLGEQPRARADLGGCEEVLGMPCGLILIDHTTDFGVSQQTPMPAPATLPILAGALIAVGVLRRKGQRV
jgi:hypothetical protein